MTEIDPLRFVLLCLTEPSDRSMFAQFRRWWRGETPPL